MTATMTRRQLLEEHHIELDDYARRTADVLRQDLMREVRSATVGVYRLVFPDPQAFEVAALALAMQVDLTRRTTPPALWDIPPTDTPSTALAIETLRAAALVRAALEDVA